MICRATRRVGKHATDLCLHDQGQSRGPGSRRSGLPLSDIGSHAKAWAANACASTKAGLAAGDPRDPVFARPIPRIGCLLVGVGSVVALRSIEQSRPPLIRSFGAAPLPALHGRFHPRPPTMLALDAENRLVLRRLERLKRKHRIGDRAGDEAATADCRSVVAAVVRFQQRRGPLRCVTASLLCSTIERAGGRDPAAPVGRTQHSPAAVGDCCLAQAATMLARVRGFADATYGRSLSKRPARSSPTAALSRGATLWLNAQSHAVGAVGSRRLLKRREDPAVSGSR